MPGFHAFASDSPIGTPIYCIYDKSVDISFDPAKNASNIDVHGISLEQANELDWASAVVVEDTRRDYGERRFQVIAFIGLRLHVFIYTPRAGKVHAISLRKANRREERQYAKSTQIKASSNGS